MCMILFFALGRVLDEGRIAVGLLHEDARAEDLLIKLEGLFRVAGKVQIEMDELRGEPPRYPRGRTTSSGSDMRHIFLQPPVGRQLTRSSWEGDPEGAVSL